MTYPTIHPFNNAPVDPAYSYWPGNTAGLVIGFCSPGAAVAWPADGSQPSNPQDWQGGTLWQLIGPPLHWTSNCWTGYTVLYVDDNGTVQSGSTGRQVFGPWNKGYIFKDLPQVRTLGIGYNVYWNGQFFSCSLSFTDFGNYGKYSGIKGRSGAVYPNMFGPASKTPVVPWYSCQLDPILCKTDCVTEFGLQSAPTYVSPDGYSWGMTNLITSYALAEDFGNPVIEYGNIDYFPAWVTSGIPINTYIECLVGNGICNCLPNYTFNEWFYFSPVRVFSEVKMSNGYSLYVFRLAA